MVRLLCPVRGCGLPLAAAPPGLACARGHTFDRAREGYVNLLQPQDRRSRSPGDAPETVRARARLRQLPAEARFVATIVGLVHARPGDSVLEVGCGDGAHVAAVAARTGCDGYGVDISTAAIAAAAKGHPRLHWIVANADRGLPYGSASFAAVLSVTARLNAAEFRRVIRDDGALIVVVPAPDDLVELREAVLGEAVVRERAGRVIDACAGHFTLVERKRVGDRERLDAAAIADVLAASYRGLRTRQRARAAALEGLDVTMARDALIFRPVVHGARSPFSRAL